MKTLITLLALFLALSTTSQSTYAAQSHAGSSAQVVFDYKKEGSLDIRSVALRNVLEKYHSHLADYSSVYVQAADLHNVDWKLLPAISGVESTFGRSYIKGTYNVYGWGSGRIYFESWEDGIITINKALRENYMNKWKARNVFEIGPFYAESKTWAIRVDYFMNQIEAEHARLASKTTLLL